MRAIEFESRLRAIPQRRDDSNMASQTFSRLETIVLASGTFIQRLHQPSASGPASPAYNPTTNCVAY